MYRSAARMFRAGTNGNVDASVAKNHKKPSRATSDRQLAHTITTPATANTAITRALIAWDQSTVGGVG